MKPIRHSALALAFSLALAATAIAASADSTAVQRKEPPAHLKHLAGGYVVGSFPMGDWGKIAGFGIGLDGSDIVQRRAGSPFAIRSNFGVLYNFSRTVDVPSANVPPPDKLTIETKNWSLFFGVGPELSSPNKTATPFVFGLVGFDTYWTSSELAGTALGLPYSAQHGDSRISFAWGAGAGVRRLATAGNLVELSVEYRSGTDHEYLRPEDVSVSGGAVRANRSSHSSDQLLVRLGTVLGD